MKTVPSSAFRPALLLTLASSLAVLSHGPTQARPQQPRLGQVPTSLVTLYDAAARDGVIEIEIDREGTIHAMEADIPVVDLPGQVLAAAKKALPGGSITGAEREIQATGPAWEVKMDVGGSRWELVIDGGGRIRESERELERIDVPGRVLDAADRAIVGGTFVSVEIVERGSSREYHVKKTKDGGHYKIVLTPDGRIVRKVREARAEIEIPLGY